MFKITTVEDKQLEMDDLRVSNGIVLLRSEERTRVMIDNASVVDVLGAACSLLGSAIKNMPSERTSTEGDLIDEVAGVLTAAVLSLALGGKPLTEEQGKKVVMAVAFNLAERVGEL